MASKSVEKAKELPSHIVKQIATLASSGFSLVAALAWNDVIRRFIDEFIKPYVTKGSGIIAQLLYALAITILVVIVTLQLGWLQARLEKNEKREKKK